MDTTHNIRLNTSLTRIISRTGRLIVRTPYPFNSLINITITTFRTPRTNSNLRNHRRHQNTSSRSPLLRHLNIRTLITTRNLSRNHLSQRRRRRRIQTISPKRHNMTTLNRTHSILTRQLTRHTRLTLTFLIILNHSTTLPYSRQRLNISRRITTLKRARSSIKLLPITIINTHQSLRLMLTTLTRTQNLRRSLRRRLTPNALNLSLTLRHPHRLTNLITRTPIRITRILRLLRRTTALTRILLTTLIRNTTRTLRFNLRQHRLHIRLHTLNLTRTTTLLIRSNLHRILRLLTRPLTNLNRRTTHLFKFLLNHHRLNNGTLRIPLQLHRHIQRTITLNSRRPDLSRLNLNQHLRNHRPHKLKLHHQRQLLRTISTQHGHHLEDLRHNRLTHNTDNLTTHLKRLHLHHHLNLRPHRHRTPTHNRQRHSPYSHHSRDPNTSRRNRQTHNRYFNRRLPAPTSATQTRHTSRPNDLEITNPNSRTHHSNKASNELVEREILTKPQVTQGASRSLSLVSPTKTDPSLHQA